MALRKPVDARLVRLLGRTAERRRSRMASQEVVQPCLQARREGGSEKRGRIIHGRTARISVQAQKRKQLLLSIPSVHRAVDDIGVDG